MKAWLLDAPLGVDHLHLGEAPDPTPGLGEVLIELHYAALNPADRYLAEGQYPARPPMPHILGRDGVGRVIALGPEVHDIQPDQVVALLRGEAGITRPGTFAQLVAVPADRVVEPPSGWTEEQAAAAPLAYLTAYQALTQWGDLPPSVVLVTGASGGVGVASVQLAHALGHTVVALSRSEDKRRTLAGLGADITLDPQDKQWPQHLKQHLGDRRVDLAIDNIGGPQFNDLLDTLGEHGRISCVGRLAGPVPNFNTASLFFRRLRLGGVQVGAYKSDAPAVWNTITSLLASTGARPLIDNIFPFDHLRNAFARLAQGPMGKVLLKIK